MDCEERARKIWDAVTQYCQAECDNGASADWIAVQLREVERETLLQPVVKEGFERAYAKGFNAAKDKAAGIAKQHECSIARGSETCNCDIEIADAIKGMQP